MVIVHIKDKINAFSGYKIFLRRKTALRFILLYKIPFYNLNNYRLNFQAIFLIIMGR